MPSPKSPADLSQLTKEQLEQRLSSATLASSERDALVEELSSRIAEEVLVGRGAPSPSEPESHSYSFEPPRVGPSPDRASEGVGQQGTGQGRRAPREEWRGAREGQPTGSRPSDPGPAPAANPIVDRPATGAQPRRRRRLPRSLSALIALAVVAVGGWGAVAALNSASDGSTPRFGPVVTPGSGDTEPEPPADDTEPQASEGAVGSTSFQWTVFGVTHVAEIETDGESGVADVTYFHPGLGEEVTVRQDLSFEEVDGIYAYIGSDPRDALTGEWIDYAPDTFFLELRDDGWHFTEVCDEGVCGAVE